MSKLNSAFQETDLDVAYFRLWSILESVTIAVTGRKHIRDVAEIIRGSYLPHDVGNVVKLTIGPESFSFDELLQMWFDWRNLAAHHGGIHAFYSGLVKIHGHNRRLISALRSQGRVVDFGEDTSMMFLRDVAVEVVRAYLAGKVKPLKSNT